MKDLSPGLVAVAPERRPCGEALAGSASELGGGSGGGAAGAQRALAKQLLHADASKVGFAAQLVELIGREAHQHLFSAPTGLRPFPAHGRSSPSPQDAEHVRSIARSRRGVAR